MNTKQILVVGEDKAMRELILTFLKRSGYSDILQTGTGQQGIEMAKSHNPSLVVVSGLDMPDMTGYEAISQIRDESPSAKILVLSGYDQQVVQPQVMAAGGNGFLQKPFTPQDLIRAVEVLLS